MATYLLRKESGGDYYWILRSDKNYKIVAMSSEGYTTRQNAMDSIEWTRLNAKDAGFEDDIKQLKFY